MRVVGKCRQKNNGGVLGLLPLSNQRRSLEAVHFRHVDVGQNDGKVLVQQSPQRFRATARANNGLLELVQHDSNGQQLLGHVVNYENLDFVVQIYQLLDSSILPPARPAERTTSVSYRPASTN